jgi:hypothetical protein
VQLVLAHYQEDLEWLRRQGWSPVIVYTKGPPSSAPGGDFLSIPLPNVGREAHTYLHHLVSRYDDLADMTIFAQAGLADHVQDVSIASLARRTADAGERGMAGFKKARIFQDWDGIRHFPKWVQQLESGAMRGSRRTPAEFYRWAFDEEPPGCVPFYAGANFGVHRHAVRARPKSFYQRLLEDFEDVGHSNPEEAHYMERFWVPVFDQTWAPGAVSVPADA